MVTKQTDTQQLATKAAVQMISMAYRKNASHIGGALSVLDVLAVLYGKVLQVYPTEPLHPDRDRLYYSKGHACTALYAILQQTGFFSTDALDSFTDNGSYFTSHVNHHVPGIELSTGSLGHALNVACGVALAGKRKKALWQVFVIVSDGELDEGSNWEAILFAPHHQLNNITLIVDYNKIQSFGAVDAVLNLEPLAQKLAAFGWEVSEVNGHDHEQLYDALQKKQPNNPRAIIAHTVKGHGVPFMEHQLAWHYKSPNEEQWKTALHHLQNKTP